MLRIATASMQVVREKLQALPRTHAVRVFVAEHDRILGFLDRLDDLIEEFRDEVGTPRARGVADSIATVARNLIAAEPHHAREEEVLFPALERRGIALPPRIMRIEHQDLRLLMHRLEQCASASHPDSEEIAETAGTMAARLRDHIAKENEVLYPMALEVLDDARIWEHMLPALRRIGPCEWSEDLFPEKKQDLSGNVIEDVLKGN